MQKITNLPTGVVGTADTNPHNEKSAYKAPKITTVQFYVEKGFESSSEPQSVTTIITGVTSSTDEPSWYNNGEDGTQLYGFGSDL